jgi:hypothetical protein
MMATKHTSGTAILGKYPETSIVSIFSDFQLICPPVSIIATKHASGTAIIHAKCRKAVFCRRDVVSLKVGRPRNRSYLHTAICQT